MSTEVNVFYAHSDDLGMLSQIVKKSAKQCGLNKKVSITPHSTGAKIEMLCKKKCVVMCNPSQKELPVKKKKVNYWGRKLAGASRSKPDSMEPEATALIKVATDVKFNLDEIKKIYHCRSYSKAVQFLLTFHKEAPDEAKRKSIPPEPWEVA